MNLESIRAEVLEGIKAVFHTAIETKEMGGRKGSSLPMSVHLLESVKYYHLNLKDYFVLDRTNSFSPFHFQVDSLFLGQRSPDSQVWKKVAVYLMRYGGKPRGVFSSGGPSFAKPDGCEFELEDMPTHVLFSIYEPMAAEGKELQRRLDYLNQLG